jgi:hypothetical protein
MENGLEIKAMQMRQIPTVLSTLALTLLINGSAWAAAQEPSITGNRWVAYGVIGALILGVMLFVFASVGMARRDEALERGHHDHNVLPGLPVLGKEEDGDE